MQTLTLLHKDKGRTCREDGDEGSETYEKAEDAITQYEAKDSTTGSTGSPIDVAALHAHELQRTLESFEHGVTDIIRT